MSAESLPVTIRPLLPADRPALEVLICDAFGAEEGPIVVQLTNDLLEDASAQPLLALVAEHAGVVVGAVLFSAALIDERPDLRVTILAPLAVAPPHQRRGVGTALIAAGLQQTAADGIDLVVVYGSPDYYGRAGFRPADGILPPMPLSLPHGWLARPHDAAPAGRVQGRLRCAASLMDAQYW